MSETECGAGMPRRVENEPLGQFAGYQAALDIPELKGIDTQDRLPNSRSRRPAGQVFANPGSTPVNPEEWQGPGRGQGLLYPCRAALVAAGDITGWYFRAGRSIAKQTQEVRFALPDAISLLVIAAGRQRRFRFKATHHWFSHSMIR